MRAAKRGPNNYVKEPAGQSNLFIFGRLFVLRSGKLEPRRKISAISLDIY
jgi:hypothetical protein